MNGIGLIYDPALKTFEKGKKNKKSHINTSNAFELMQYNL